MPGASPWAVLRAVDSLAATMPAGTAGQVATKAARRSIARTKLRIAAGTVEQSVFRTERLSVCLLAQQIAMGATGSSTARLHSGQPCSDLFGVRAIARCKSCGSTL